MLKQSVHFSAPPLPPGQPLSITQLPFEGEATPKPQHTTNSIERLPQNQTAQGALIMILYADQAQSIVPATRRHIKTYLTDSPRPSLQPLNQCGNCIELLCRHFCKICDGLVILLEVPPGPLQEMTSPFRTPSPYLHVLGEKQSLNSLVVA
jgi:hypothetical protein